MNLVRQHVFTISGVLRPQNIGIILWFYIRSWHHSSYIYSSIRIEHHWKHVQGHRGSPKLSWKKSKRHDKSRKSSTYSWSTRRRSAKIQIIQNVPISFFRFRFWGSVSLDPKTCGDPICYMLRTDSFRGLKSRVCCLYCYRWCFNAQYNSVFFATSSGSFSCRYTFQLGASDKDSGLADITVSLSLTHRFLPDVPKRLNTKSLFAGLSYSQKHIWFDRSHWGLVTILQFDQQNVMSYRYHSFVRQSLLHVSLAIITYLTYLIIVHNSYSSTAFFRLNLPLGMMIPMWFTTWF